MKAKWKNIKQKHFFQPYEVNAARKGNVSGKYFINSYNTAILLPGNNEFEIYDSGVAVLDPTEENYEDAFSDMYVKVIAFHGDTYSHPTWHKLKENRKGDLYFTKYRRRYYLKDMMRTNY